MTVFHGKGGSATFAGAIADLQSWTLDTSSDTADTTAMSDDFETHNGGLTDFTATAEGIANTTTDSIGTYLGIGGALVLSCSASHYFTMTVICTGYGESVTIDDVGKFTMAFEGNDANGAQYT